MSFVVFQLFFNITCTSVGLIISVQILSEYNIEFSYVKFLGNEQHATKCFFLYFSTPLYS